MWKKYTIDTQQHLPNVGLRSTRIGENPVKSAKGDVDLAILRK
jgi:hypothetical protein